MAFGLCVKMSLTLLQLLTCTGFVLLMAFSILASADPVTGDLQIDDVSHTMLSMDANSKEINHVPESLGNDTSPLQGRSLRGRGGRGKRCRVRDGTKCQFSSCGRGRLLTNCAVGFAAGVVGGRRGVSYIVTRSDDVRDNPVPGMLRYGTNIAYNNPTGVWITFAHDMTIWLQDKLLLTNYTTIDGRGVKVVIKGSAVAPLHCHNVILHNFEASGSPSFDTIHLFDSTKVWVDHVTSFDGQLGLISAVQGSTDVTISNCRLYNNHYVMLLGSSNEDTIDQNMRVTIYRNWFRNSNQRMPHCRWGYCHVVNNLYGDWGLYAISGLVYAKMLSERNVFVAGAVKEVTEWYPRYWTKWDTSITIESRDDLLLNGATFHQFLPSGGLSPPPYMHPRDYPPTVNTFGLARLVGRCSGALLPLQIRSCFRYG